MIAQLEGVSREDSGFILFSGVNCYWAFKKRRLALKYFQFSFLLEMSVALQQ